MVHYSTKDSTKVGFCRTRGSFAKLPLVGGDFKFVEDSAHRTNRLAIGTIDAYFCIDEIHIFGIRGRDAADRTDFQARGILNSNTGFGNYKTQGIPLFTSDESLRRFFDLLKGSLFPFGSTRL